MSATDNAPMTSQSKTYLGIDVGGSGIKGAVVDVESGMLVVERYRIPTPQPATPDAVGVAVGSIVEHFEWRGPVGVAVSAVVKDGITKTAANVDDAWINCDAGSLFGSHVGTDVTVLNDADAGGIAEVTFGAARARSGLVIMVTLGTGIGVALVCDGRLIPNSELGHLEIRGVKAEHRAADSAREREELSWKQYARRVDEFLHALHALMWPDLFVIGGGVSKRADKFVPLLKVPVETVAAELVNNAGIVGAALAAHRAAGR